MIIERIRKLDRDEAKKIIQDAARSVDWHNLGCAIDMLGEMDLEWGRYINGKIPPNYERVYHDHYWLKNNGEKLAQGLMYMKTHKVVDRPRKK